MKRRFIPVFLAALLLGSICCLPSQALAQAPSGKQSIVAALNQVSQEFGAQFVYDPELLGNKTTSFNTQNLKGKKLEEVLKSILYPNNLVFLYVRKNYYTIVSKDRMTGLMEGQNDSAREQPAPNAKSNDQLQLTGKVINENDLPIGQASVAIKGTSKGVRTGADGNFSIPAVAPDATLVFSFVGYDPKEVRVENRNFLEVKLLPKTDSMEDVIVVGFGTQKKSDVTGSVASANLKDFKNTPSTNVAQMLQGSVPGLNVGQVNSAGSTPSINIRGANTISGNKNVLIILDGIQFNGSLESINPDDIASIDVLKDASATAVYGAQAANGVLMVTTKKGKNGQPRFSFSSSYSTQTPTNNLRPLKRDAYLEHIIQLNYDKAYLAPDYTKPNPDFDITDVIDGSMMDKDGQLVSTDFDWWDAGTNTGYINDNQLSITGGSDRFTYLFSGAYTEQSGFFINDKFKRKSLRINMDMKVTDWWTLGIQSFGSFVNKDGAEPSMNAIIDQSPLVYPYDEEGKLKPFPFNTNYKNPFLTYDVDDYERHNYLFANLYSDLNVPFIKGLNYRINFGNNYRNNKHNRASIYGAGLSGRAFKQDENYYDYTFDNILTYKHQFAKHDLTATLLYGAIERKFNYTDANAEGFSRLSLGYNSLEQGLYQYANSDAWREALSYQMARVNYKYDDKYLLTATIRRDGFSGFAANHKYGYFPSLALGWVLTKESFFQPDWIDFLKLRAGYGVSGNQTSRYSSLARMSSGAAYVFGDGGDPLFGQKIESMANPDLNWERTAGISAGLDFTLLNGRLSGALDYYNNHTKDLLFSVKIPNINGFSEINSNVGELRNSGVELALTSVNVNRQDFRWTSTLSFSHNKNRILKLTGFDADGDGKEDDLVASGLFIGHSINTAFDYVVDGVYQIGDDIPKGYHPGNYRIVDENNDGEITEDDRRIIGSNDPLYRASLLNKLEYKGFTLTVFLNTVQGGKNGYLADNSPSLKRDDNAIRNNNLNDVDFWSPVTPNGKYAQYLVEGTLNPAVFYQRNFVRLQDVSLSYRFSGPWVKKLNLQNLNLFVSGKNLATWTKWEGWDPETNQGLVKNGRPVMKGYMIGLNISF